MKTIMAALVCAGLAACAGAGRSGDFQPRPSSRGGHDYVAVEELRRSSQAGSLYEVLSRIRPHMVQPRAGLSAMRGMRGGIDVFINGQYAGGEEVLRSLQPTHVASVRMVQRSQAYVQYGGWLRGDHALFVALMR
jgi:hypothetical protein